MECKLTHVAPPFRLNGGSGQMVNVTDGCCAATITTRYEAIGPTNILTLAPSSSALTAPRRTASSFRLTA